jgi:hypothetical protein
MPGSASPLPEVFRDLSVYRLLAFGALMMVIMIVRPQGCCPKAVRKKVVEPPTPAAPPTASAQP